MKFIENNCDSKLMRNKTGCENLHVILHPLDEVYTEMSGTLAKILCCC